jgi:8-oxo-dGTP pyrophosphatase MutT (NUDIX family)
MKLIQIIDYSKSNQLLVESKRIAVRAIIFKDHKLMMIQSQKIKEYKFPGGGKLNNESHLDALIRETKEETGLHVIPSTIKPYGFVKEIRKSNIKDNQLFEMESYYYTCEVEDGVFETNLDAYEIEYNYQLKCVEIDQAIHQNESCLNQIESAPWIYRELIVLKDLKETLYNKEKQYEII